MANLLLYLGGKINQLCYVSFMYHLSFFLQKNASLIMPWVNLARIALVLDAPKMLASFTYFATFPTILLLLFMCIRLIAHIEYYTIDFKSLVACGHLRRGWRRGNCDYVIYEKVHMRFFVEYPITKNGSSNIFCANKAKTKWDNVGEEAGHLRPEGGEKGCPAFSNVM